MKVSDQGIAELISHEALVTSPYRDSVGVWTIGVGHTAGAGKPYPASMEKGKALPLNELAELFRRDLAKYEGGVLKVVKVPLRQHEFDALVSFHFNTGAIATASFVKKLNAGDRKGAAEGMMAWNKPPEILGRRRKEMRLFRDGKYSNDGKCTVYEADAAGRVQRDRPERVPVASLFPSIAPAPTPEPAKPPPVVEPLRHDGKHESPASERSWWSRVVNKLLGKEP
jgi:lysozyme